MRGPPAKGPLDPLRTAAVEGQVDRALSPGQAAGPPPPVQPQLESELDSLEADVATVLKPEQPRSGTRSRVRGASRGFRPCRRRPQTQPGG